MLTVHCCTGTGIIATAGGLHWRPGPVRRAVVTPLSTPCSVHAEHSALRCDFHQACCPNDGIKSKEVCQHSLESILLYLK